MLAHGERPLLARAAASRSRSLSPTRASTRRHGHAHGAYRALFKLRRPPARASWQRALRRNVAREEEQRRSRRRPRRPRRGGAERANLVLWDVLHRCLRPPAKNPLPHRGSGYGPHNDKTQGEAYWLRTFVTGPTRMRRTRPTATAKRPSTRSTSSSGRSTTCTASARPISRARWPRTVCRSAGGCRIDRKPQAPRTSRSGAARCVNSTGSGGTLAPTPPGRARRPPRHPRPRATILLVLAFGVTASRAAFTPGARVTRR